MKITVLNKLKLIFNVYSCLQNLYFRHIFGALINPIDSTRYTEFTYLLKYLKTNPIPLNSSALDISSPFIMAYLLSKNNKVTKTDINPAENLYIKSNNNFEFKLEDGTNLTFSDSTFDLVYSISVIEHIYNAYNKAIAEMIRVCKPGGVIYLSFPVSNKYQEEWLEQDIYSHQHKMNKKTFFQYRFDEQALNNLLGQINGASVVSKDIYWERHDGSYNEMTRIMRNRLKNKYLEKFRMAFLNFYYGFCLLENESAWFDKSKNLGNVSLILRKNQ
ncbi:MAG: hypothetical protein A3J93_01070 [Candidatus Magasanikbacteria bacterium RIFOXYC2_FULL_42_28]|uniref:Methyltransferase type 11 domain-containing protein n=1 Tax=Candidatus Magasanikbacteria bacterium RIFOXYC2_FULL_42_28 TaxID=1798704 RepID=A0A1F6NXX1_9BACT|nr:MAG: hypothetical protein A3J93_01070 [Candidatus Magasanikbacteria bacterium RIFOXYC2_FULL_42_28]